MARLFLIPAAINGFLAVGLGAFGAHVLEDRLTADALDTFGTGTHYHLTHALGLAIVALLCDRRPKARILHGSGWLMFAGIVIFCGTLYGIVFTGIHSLGAITPIGGFCFLGGWLTLAIGAWKHLERQN